ncbi:MAG TPA: diguanylate cyclase, partial [Armatimonadota bacterium]
VAWRILRRHSIPGIRSVAWMLLAVACWALGAAWEFGFHDLPGRLLAIKCQYPGIALVPTLFFIAQLEYFGYESLLTWRNRLLLSIIPLLGLLLIWTNELHGWMYARTWLDTSHAGVPILAISYGPAMWLFIVYSYLLTLCGLLVAFRAVLTASPYYRAQAWLLIIAIAAPATASVVYVLRLSPIPYLDTTPLVFAFSGALFTLGMLRYQLWVLKPVAHQVIVNSIADGIIVLNAEERIAEMNPAAEAMLGLTPALVLGRPAEVALPAWLYTGALLIPGAEECRQIVSPPDASLVYEVRLMALRSYTGGITGRLLLLRDDTKRRQLEARLEAMAFYDGLTGLPNRTLFQDRLEQALTRGRRLRSSTAIIFLDLDNFKDINDTRGHSAGDLVLYQVAERLSACVRASDTVARLGGDEFMVVLPEVQSMEDVIRTADRILAACAIPLLVGGAPCYITPSLGLTIAPRDGDSVKELMLHADQAMYRAKQEGKNRYVMYA